MIDLRTRLEADEPLANPQEFKRAVAEALHGKTAGRLAATILRAMLRGIKSTAELEAGAREAARAAIARTAVACVHPALFCGRPVYVMPHPSGLNAHVTVHDLADHFAATRRLADADGG